MLMDAYGMLYRRLKQLLVRVGGQGHRAIHLTWKFPTINIFACHLNLHIQLMMERLGEKFSLGEIASTRVDKYGNNRNQIVDKPTVYASNTLQNESQFIS